MPPTTKWAPIDKRSASIRDVCRTCQQPLDSAIPSGSPYQAYELKTEGYCSIVCRALVRNTAHICYGAYWGIKE